MQRCRCSPGRAMSHRRGPVLGRDARARRAEVPEAAIRDRRRPALLSRSSPERPVDHRRVHEASYLAGWLATRMEQRRPGRDVVGVVGGARVPPVEDSSSASGPVPGRLRQRCASSRATRTTSGPDEVRGNRAPSDARGAGVVLHVANRCGLGALRAAKRAGVWGIGVDSDQSSLGPHILTSVVKKYDAVMLTLLRQVRDGRIRAGVTTEVSLRGNGAGLGRISPGRARAGRRERCSGGSRACWRTLKRRLPKAAATRSRARP